MKNSDLAAPRFARRALEMAVSGTWKGFLNGSALMSYVTALAWLLAAGTALGNPCLYPKRLVNRYTVDLRPLMQWWAEPKGLRPLSGWKHVRGTITEDTALGWVMTGKAGGETHTSKFFLRNPPRERLQRFQEIKRRLPELDKDRVATQEFVQRPVHSYWDRAWAVPRPTPVMSVAEHKAAAERLRLLDQEIQGLREELAPMQDAEGNFRLDAFALRLNERYQGLPVFDHGYPMGQL
jgi:hypothetical protein